MHMVHYHLFTLLPLYFVFLKNLLNMYWTDRAVFVVSVPKEESLCKSDYWYFTIIHQYYLPTHIANST